MLQLPVFSASYEVLCHTTFAEKELFVLGRLTSGDLPFGRTDAQTEKCNIREISSINYCMHGAHIYIKEDTLIITCIADTLEPKNL